MKSFFYILECSDGTYYYGSTKNLEDRIACHSSGKVQSTKHKRPVKLVYSESFRSYKAANIREYEVKSWKSRKRAEQLINMARSSSG